MGIVTIILYGLFNYAAGYIGGKHSMRHYKWGYEILMKRKDDEI